MCQPETVTHKPVAFDKNRVRKGTYVSRFQARAFLRAYWTTQETLSGVAFLTVDNQVDFEIGVVI